MALSDLVSIHYRTEAEILADPATHSSTRLRIQADQFGRALFQSMREHEEKFHPERAHVVRDWDTDSGLRWTWRSAIYGMLAKMNVPPSLVLMEEASDAPE